MADDIIERLKASAYSFV